MNKNRFIELVSLQHPITPADLKDLEDLIKSFPYCQSAHILLAKGSHDAGTMLSDQLLRKAAAYTVDRKNLKMVISKPLIEKSIEGPENNDAIVPIETKSDLPNENLPTQEIINQNIEEPDQSNTTDTKSDLHQQPTSKIDFSELEDNLRKLKELKRKAGEEIEEQENIADPIKTSLPKHEEVIIDKIRESENLESESLKPVFEVKDEKSDKVFLISDLDEPFLPQVLYASRLEEVYSSEDLLQKKISNPDHELLLAYLGFLESKRSRLNKQVVTEIIQKFIKEDPIIPYIDTNKIAEEQEDLTENLRTDIGPVSENFANLLVKQGKFQKAIEIFQKLLLKNPEKNAYFANRIEELRGKLNS